MLRNPIRETCFWISVVFKEVQLQSIKDMFPQQPDGRTVRYKWEGPHQDSACSSHSLQSKGRSRLWAEERPARTGSPVSLWCHCLEKSRTATRQRRRHTKRSAALPRVLGTSSMRIRAAARYLWARQTEMVRMSWVSFTVVGNCCTQQTTGRSLPPISHIYSSRRKDKAACLLRVSTRARQGLFTPPAQAGGWAASSQGHRWRNH